MKTILSERNIAVALFFMVLVAFSLAQEDTRKMEKINTGTAAATAAHLLVIQQDIPLPLHADQ